MTLSIAAPTVGSDLGVWGAELNAALAAIVAAINTNAANAATPASVTTVSTGLAAEIARALGVESTLVRVVSFGSNASTSRGGVGGVVLWVGAAGVSPTNFANGDLVWNTP